MNREHLEKPFSADQLRQRKGNFGNTLDYVEAHAVIKRLNDALESDWSFEVLEHRIMEEVNEVIVLGQLSTQGITKSQFGSSTITRAKETGEIISLADDLKAAASDSVKKCATLLGVGLHLYGTRQPADKDPGNDRQNVVTPIHKTQRNKENQPANGRISSKQHGYILSLAQSKGWTRKELSAHCVDVFGATLDYISRKDASSLIEKLRSDQASLPAPNAAAK